MSSADELLDVVDVEDRVIGVRRRGDIHAEGLMHRAVHVLGFNAQGELFLQKRSMSKDEQPGRWDSSAAGHVDSGEDYHQCAERELAEELGIRVTAPPRALFKMAACLRTGNEHCMVYRYDHDGPMQLQAEEIDDGAWVSAQEMDRRITDPDAELTDAIRLIWQRLREA